MKKLITIITALTIVSLACATAPVNNRSPRHGAYQEFYQPQDFEIIRTGNTVRAIFIHLVDMREVEARTATAILFSGVVTAARQAGPNDKIISVVASHAGNKKYMVQLNTEAWKVIRAEKLRMNWRDFIDNPENARIYFEEL